MNFATPSMFAWALLGLPIILFYILKIRLRRVPVSTVMFWQKVFEEKRPRSIWQRLRHLWSLLLQLIFLALLVAALCEPFFEWEVLEARRIVLVVDNSASMAATDVEEGSRLDHAKELALEQVDGLRHHDDMAIVIAGTRAQVASGLTGHKKTLREAVEAIGQTDGPTRVADAVALARRLLRGEKKQEIVVITDGAFAESGSFVEADDVRIAKVGTDAPNVGITQLQVRRSAVDPVGFEVLAEVKNFSDAEREFRFELDLAGNVVDVIPIKLEPGGTWRNVFNKSSREGGLLEAIIDTDDALATDNRAFALLPKTSMQRVLLVTSGNPFLQLVFEASPLVNLEVVETMPANGAPDRLMVLHGNVPDQLPKGRIFIVDPNKNCDLFDVADPIEDPLITEQDENSPLMKHVQLTNVHIPKARTVKPKTKPEVLAASLDESPVFMRIPRADGDVLVLSVELEEGDLTLRTAFPIMVANVLAWQTGEAAKLREAAVTGAVADVGIETDDPAADTLAVVTSPDGKTREKLARFGDVPVGPLHKVGTWTVAAKDDPSKTAQLAVNLSNPDESDLRAREGCEDEGLAATAGFGGQPSWWYLVLAGLLLTATEWCLYQRRVVA